MKRVLVIFGAAVRPDGSPSGTLRRRINGAFAVGGVNRDVVFMPTGGAGRYGPPEAHVMRDQLVTLGVDPALILVEDRACDTLQSIYLCHDLIRNLEDSVVVEVCTSPYHQFRCWALFRLAGLPARCPRMPGDRAALGMRKSIFYWFRELPATIWDVFLILIGRGRVTLSV